MRSGFVAIGGPDQLQPRGTLKVPISCRLVCDTTARTKLKLPDHVVGPDKATGHLVPGKPRKLVVRLNDLAAADLQQNFSSARLRVAVTAVNDSGRTVHALRIFTFSAPSP